MKIRADTLRRQLVLWLAAPLAVLWSISTMIDYDIAHQFVTSAYDRSLLDSAIDIGKQIKVREGRIRADLPEVVLDMLVTGEPGRFFYLITGPRGEFIAGHRDLPPPPEPDDEKVTYYDGEYQGRPLRLAALHLPLEGDVNKGMVLVQVAETVTGRTDFARQIMLRMMLPQAVLILLAALAVWYAVGRGLAPLGALQREIASRSHRDLGPLPEEHSPREVRPLIHAMNGLLERLSLALAVQQRFIADAAHQLRTPLAGLKTQTELALRQAQADDVRATLRQLHAGTERTTRLVNQLLSLARAEPGADRARASDRLDLAQLARETTTEWVPRAIDRDIDLGYDGGEERACVIGDPFLLKEMLNNLLDNATRYTEPGGQVTVRVKPDTTRVVLSVEDNGPGVPEAERDRVFERFHRVLGTGADGCGLGLPIVREIAQSHGGNAELASREGGAGTLVRVTLPIARQDETRPG
ncbi:MAG: sensor histidine kinase N-terminal domain-containing protein [Burkholderiales bacterium]|nr:sensor histidine kinase N-terminal domain-containing protein [Burkholderiales bacterium]